MDLEESFASAPVRYALDDVDSDEEVEASVNIQKVSVKTDLSVTSVDYNTKLTLLLGLEGPGNVYINSLQSNETVTVVGTVFRLEEGKEAEIKASIMQLAQTKTLLIPFVGEIKPEEAGQYTRAILSSFVDKIERVIVLDSFTAVGFTSEVWGDNLVPPFLRILQTSPSPAIKGLTLYEAPNMIKGLSAAIVNYCEIHSIACYDLLTLQESIYGKLLITTETLEAYNQGLRQLGLNVKFDEAVMDNILATRHSGRVDDGHHRLYL